MAKSLPKKHEDTKCVLCGKDIIFGERVKGKVGNKHHISYARDTVINLCYICHNIIHLRLKFGNPFDKRFGADYGSYVVSRRIIRLFERYPEVIRDIHTKYPEEFNAKTEQDQTHKEL